MSDTVYGITKDKFKQGDGPVCEPLRGVGVTWLMPGHGGCTYPDHRCAGDERCPFTKSRANPKTGLHSPLWPGAWGRR